MKLQKTLTQTTQKCWNIEFFCNYTFTLPSMCMQRRRRRLYRLIWDSFCRPFSLCEPDFIDRNILCCEPHKKWDIYSLKVSYIVLSVSQPYVTQQHNKPTHFHSLFYVKQGFHIRDKIKPDCLNVIIFEHLRSAVRQFSREDLSYLVQNLTPFWGKSDHLR